MCTIFQILVVSLCTAWCIETVYELKSSLIVFCLSLVWFLLPYNIVLSSNLTKDVLFATMMLFMSTAILRILFISVDKTVKDSVIEYILLLVGIIGTGLFRSNGTIIVVIMAATIVAVSLRKKSFHKVAGIFLTGAILCLILKYPVLNV